MWRASFVGYASVCTDDQSLAWQREALLAAGCNQVFEDRSINAVAQRPGLLMALAACGIGDVLTVWKLDRLGRSVQELLDLVEDLKRHDVGLKILMDDVSLDVISRNSSTLAVFGAIPEFGIELLCERIMAGMQAERRRDRRLSGPRKLPFNRLDQSGNRIYSGCQGKLAKNTIISRK